MMKPEAILASDLLDIVFEDRNKEYGAYLLRKEYNHRLLIALTSVPVIMALFVWINYLNKTVHSNLFSTPAMVAPDVVMSRVAMEKPLPEPKPLEKARPRNMATIKNSTPVIMANVATTDPLPTVHELLNDNRAIGNVTQEGEAPAGNTADGNASAGSANGEAAPASAAAPEAVLHLASVMPEYPGGVAALHRFLARNLRVPENVIEPGQRINIPVRFVVNKTGELSDVEFLVQVNEPIKQEVLRVMRKMPAWKPGLQNGRPVAVYFTVPIVFEVSE